MRGELEVQIMGEEGLMIDFGSKLSREVNIMVKIVSEKLEELRGLGIKEVIPAYTTILAVLDPLKADRDKLINEVRRIVRSIKPEDLKEEVNRVIEVPTVYDPQYGLDLEDISKLTKLSIEEIINLHSSQVYRVYMVGFIPGFPYMGEVPEKIAVPRLENPRIKVPAGSVGIAGVQTGIYPFESPGGWRIIGRTPLRLFNPNKDPPTLFKIGDYVKFKPISREAYEKMLEAEWADVGKLKIEGEPILRVEAAGPGVSIQDLGREGYRKYGVPVSGALDKESFIIANMIVGNEINDACIEIFQSSFEATVLQDIIISICGAKVDGEIDGEPLENCKAIPVRRGCKITINGLRGGMVAYMAIAGGINEPIILGSRSYYTTAGIGRILSENSIITTAKNKFNELIDVCPSMNIDWNREVNDEFRVIIGPHIKHFTEEMMNEFLSMKFTVTSNLNRMGYRLERGEEAKLRGVGRLLSCGTIPGAIQVPGDGNPIVLMADAQTTGGYAIIGKIISPDLYAFSQVEPGRKVKFKQVSLSEALKILDEKVKMYDDLRRKIQEKVREFGGKYKHWTVKFQGKIYDCWVKM